MAGRVAMRGLMHRDGEQYRQGINGDSLNQVGNIHPWIVSDAANNQLQPQRRDVATALPDQHRFTP